VTEPLPADGAASPDLTDLCRAAVDAAHADEAVEAFAQEARRTQVRARAGGVQSLSFAESRGVGVRVIAGGRLGYAYAANPSVGEVAALVTRARENAAFATPDEFNVLPAPDDAAPMPELFRDSLATLPTDRKVEAALALDRLTVAVHPSVRKVEEASYGDAVSRLAVVSTTGAAGEYARTDCWCAVASLAEENEETQTGFAFRLGHELDELDLEACAIEAAERGARLLGSRKPPTARVPVVLDPHVGVSFLGVLAGALSAESVQKGRSLFASLLDQVVASEAVTLVDDGRHPEGPAAAPFDDEGVPTGRTALIEGGKLARFLHNTYTARRGDAESNGNASRGGYRTPPGVGVTNLYIEPGRDDPTELLARADGGVLVQEVSGVHSGASPISGEFSVGATGLRISGGALGEPLREMTIASTLPDMLKAVAGVGADLRFFGGAGSPTILLAEMTVAGT
jgi:PmbA protein